MRRKTELYKVFIGKKELDNSNDGYFMTELKAEDILKNFLEYYYEEIIDEMNDIQSKNLAYITKIVENDLQNNDIRHIKMEYVKYNKSLTVVDKKTFNGKYKKTKEQGDLEKQHYSIRLYSDTNRAIIALEKIIGAVNKSLLQNNFNFYYKKWINEKFSDECEQKELLKYIIKIDNVPSPDFVEELGRFDRISLLQVTVGKEKITNDEDIAFSEDNVSRDTVDLSYRPISGLSFSKSNVEKYYKKFQEQKGKEKIKRIIITGKQEGQSIRLDTEGMKYSQYIEAKLDLDGVIDTEEIFKKYSQLLNENLKEYINNMFISLNEE